MKRSLQKMISMMLSISLLAGCTGCGQTTKEPKPTPKASASVNKGNANAGGSGEGQADIPLVVGSTKFSKQFNPFLASTKADKQVVDLTQVYLVTNDRSGKLVYNGIDGELREYNGENYTYYGATDISIKYNKSSDTTVYRIKLRDDLVFSDGEKLTIDDVIFSMYVFCDSDYDGDAVLKNMPIKGLTNYLANSSKAEKISDKKVAKYIKKHKKALSKQIGEEDEYYDTLLERQARIALAKKTGKKVKSISGIKKINDYEMKIVTTGYTKEMSSALKIPICALHYYGDTTKFNLKKNSFGFERGNISAILANKTNPVGAGAYRFVKYEDDVVYFNSNELYYLGCPNIAYLQLKDMTEILKETNSEIAKKRKEQEESAAEETDKEAEPQATVNPVAEIMEVTGGTVDVLSATFSTEELQWIAEVNSSGDYSGDVLNTDFIGNGSYYYIGINASNVSVGGEADSNASKYLRKALASVLSDARAALTQKEGANVRLIDYPVMPESWLSPTKSEDNYTVAYSKNLQGIAVYDSDDQASTERTKLVSDMALEYLEKAGYRIQDGKVVSAPKGASTEYTVWVADGKENALYPVLENAAQVLSEMGITLKLQTIDGEELLQKKLQKQKQQIWVGVRSAYDMNMQERYQEKGNAFGIKDTVLNTIIQDLQEMLSSDERKEKYQRCFEYILDWAVEVPVCEYRTATLYSSERIDEDTIAEDTTLYYSWMNEIQKVEMR